MHRDVVTHVAVSAADFFISGSTDGKSLREDILILDVCLNHQILSSLLSRSPEILEEKAYWY